MVETTELHSHTCAHQSTTTSAAVWLQLVTIIWMLVECSTGLFAARKARSVALLAFGSDSLVELLSAVVVLLQFTSTIRLPPHRATRVAGLLLYGLAAIITLSSLAAFASGNKPDTSSMGIAITAAALLLMPVLARLKRRKARELNNPAMAADAVQSATCAYLAAVTLTTLGVNAIFHITWLDPVAALIAVPLIVREGQRAYRGESCGCC